VWGPLATPDAHGSSLAAGSVSAVRGRPQRRTSATGVWPVRFVTGSRNRRLSGRWRQWPRVRSPGRRDACRGFVTSSSPTATGPASARLRPRRKPHPAMLQMSRREIGEDRGAGIGVRPQHGGAGGDASPTCKVGDKAKMNWSRSSTFSARSRRRSLGSPASRELDRVEVDVGPRILSETGDVRATCTRAICEGLSQTALIHLGRPGNPNDQ
jgi:hypothetical protein